MSTKKISDFTKIVDGFKVINLDEEEVKNIVKGGMNVYNIFSSYYHDKLKPQPKINYSSLDGVKFTELLPFKTCHNCARNHISTDCSFSICKKCGNRGHSSKKCSNPTTPSKSTLCKKCAFTPHSEFDCPAIYRKYKIKKEITKVKKACGNCAGKHFTNDCPASLEGSKFSVFDEKFLAHIKKNHKKN